MAKELIDVNVILNELSFRGLLEESRRRIAEAFRVGSLSSDEQVILENAAQFRRKHTLGFVVLMAPLLDEPGRADLVEWAVDNGVDLKDALGAL